MCVFSPAIYVDTKATGGNEFTCDAVLPRLHQAGRLDAPRKPEGIPEQRFTRSADNSAPIRFPSVRGPV